ncbi:hypothetical protein FL583_21245 [Cryptosporangium phraense]|uniref:Uncharacterized protein n=1 Tax=Cryptosporangium phraense TaxID=2593070 RepID=A0A545ANW9_9ACTN|nr:hypothetical protein FL583_21245 [Cryptosporangium phraense]
MHLRCAMCSGHARDSPVAPRDARDPRAASHAFASACPRRRRVRPQRLRCVRLRRVRCVRLRRVRCVRLRRVRCVRRPSSDRAQTASDARASRRHGAPVHSAGRSAYVPPRRSACTPRAPDACVPTLSRTYLVQVRSACVLSVSVRCLRRPGACTRGPSSGRCGRRRRRGARTNVCGACTTPTARASARAVRSVRRPLEHRASVRTSIRTAARPSGQSPLRAVVLSGGRTVGVAPRERSSDGRRRSRRERAGRAG